jgi:hypothetical protein
MSLKLKALGLGVLTMLACSAFAAMNAGANSPGHFVSENHHTIIKGLESGDHRLHLTGDFGDGQIGCNKAEYHATSTGTTVESITVTPTYSECLTTGGTPGSVTVTHNGCNYTFTMTTGAPSPVHLSCPTGKAIEIHHPNCTITVAGPQTVNNAVEYTTDMRNGKHSITMHVAAKFNSQYHGGICIFLGTSHTGELNGSSTVWGEDTLGNPVGITAT